MTEYIEKSNLDISRGGGIQDNHKGRSHGIKGVTYQ